VLFGFSPYFDVRPTKFVVIQAAAPVATAFNVAVDAPVIVSTGADPPLLLYGDIAAPARKQAFSCLHRPL
jgi:hypothetical protein